MASTTTHPLYGAISSIKKFIERISTESQIKVSEEDNLQKIKLQHSQLWDKKIGSMVSSMTYLAGYSNESQRVHRSFFSERVSRTLGPYPNGSQGTHIWKSFMTDDHTPVELSWSWGAKDSTPAVRYAAEPISWEAGSALDPLNSKACLTCLGDTLPWAPTLDLKWYRHFLKALTWTPDYDCAKQAMSAHPPSKTFIAFDMEEDTMVVKYYFMPTLKATCSGKSNLELVEESILALPGDHSFAKSFGVITDFIRSFPLAQQPKVEILAVDCVDPSESRLKIYVRCNETTFDSMINAMTLGGRIPSFSDSTIDSLKELWCGCFSVEDTPEALSQPLGGTAHRTSGLLYYFEIKTGASKPTSKVYLPVRHYAKSDDQVAMGVSKFLQRRGKTLQGGVSYYEGLRKICTHRDLKDGLGFQTYITAAVKGEDISINTYINPEVYDY